MFARTSIPQLSDPASVARPEADFRRSAPDRGDAPPASFNIGFGGGLADNLLTQGAVSTEDAGVGVVSGMSMGPKRSMLGSFKPLHEARFASRMTQPPTAGDVRAQTQRAQFRPLILD